VELALIVHDHVEVTFKEGGRSEWIGRIDLTGSLSRLAATINVVFSFEVVHHRVLSIDKLVDVGHEVGAGVGIYFVDLFEELDVGYPLFVVGYDVFILDTCESVAVLKVAVSVLSESFITPHPQSGEVICVARTIAGCLVVGDEESWKGCPRGDALHRKTVEPQEWRFAHHKGKYPAMWSSLPPEARARDAVHLEPNTWVRATVVFFDGWLEILGVSDRPKTT
jgi:hypothetical protein